MKQRIAVLIFGLFLSVLLLEAGLRMGGFIYLSLQEYRNIKSIKEKGEYRILCLGESTTADWANMASWPRQLERVLNQRRKEIKFSVINKGLMGTNSRAIVSQLESNLEKYNPNMVIVMMGINDEAKTATYKDIRTRKTEVFFKLRTYKLLKLLRMHIINKVKEIVVNKRRVNITFINKAYAQADNFEEQEKFYKKDITINPEDDFQYVELGRYYYNIGELDKAIEIYKKAIELNPKNAEAYSGLGWCITFYQGAAELPDKYNRAERMFKKAIEISPRSISAYMELGRWYRGKKNIREVEMYKKAIEITQELNVEKEKAYIGLGKWYIKQGKYREAEKILKTAILKMPSSDRIYGILALLYQVQGKNKLAEIYFRKTNEIRLKSYDPITRHNYMRLKEIVTQRKIKLVCMQYPMRSVEPLKKMLEPHDGIIFVDNEMVFKKAIRQERYDEYFSDMFGGDFGHCTDKGNRLLAKNIADVILNKIKIY